MASWQFILFGVSVAVALSSAADCNYEGQTFADGSKFKLPSLSGNCVEYTCKNGGFSSTTEECEQGGSCFPLGHELVINCYKKKCEKDDQGIGFTTKESQCSLNGQCYPLGHEIVHNCVKRVCEENEGSVGFVNKEIKCANGDECIEPNTPFSATIDGVVYGNSKCIITGDGVVMFQYQQ